MEFDLEDFMSEHINSLPRKLDLPANSKPCISAQKLLAQATQVPFKPSEQRAGLTEPSLSHGSPIAFASQMSQHVSTQSSLLQTDLLSDVVPQEIPVAQQKGSVFQLPPPNPFDKHSQAGQFSKSFHSPSP